MLLLVNWNQITNVSKLFVSDWTVCKKQTIKKQNKKKKKRNKTQKPKNLLNYYTKNVYMSKQWTRLPNFLAENNLRYDMTFKSINQSNNKHQKIYFSIRRNDLKSFSIQLKFFLIFVIVSVTEFDFKKNVYYLQWEKKNSCQYFYFWWDDERN